MRRRMLLAIAGLTTAAFIGLRVWFSEGAVEIRLRQMPLTTLQQRVTAGQADFLSARVLGERLMDAGRDQEAEPIFRKLIGADRANWAAYVRLGTLLGRTGRQSEAFQVLMIPVTRRPDLPEAHRALGELYLTRQAYPQAIRELQTAARLEPGEAEVWYQLSQCYDALAQPSRARAALERAIRSDPREDRYLVDLARLLRKAGKPEAAEPLLQRALSLNPDSAPAHYTRGEILAARPSAADSQAAASEFHTVLRLAPGYPPAHYQLGLLAMRRRDWAEAAVELEQALKSAPAFKEAVFNLARTYDRLGRAAEASQLRARFARLSEQEQQILDLRARLGFGGENRDTYLRLARAYRAAGNLERAYETLVAARQRFPGDPETRAEMQAVASLAGRPMTPVAH